MKKILFINPNHLWYTHKDAYFSKGQTKLRKIVPPLGIAYLASILRKQDLEVEIIEANALNLSIIEVVKKTINYNPDLILISSFFTTVDSTIKLSTMLKKNLKIPIIVGGAGPSAEPHKFVKFFDIVYIGEGEKSIIDIITQKPLEKISGIAFIKNKKVIINPEKKKNINLDSLPFPSWDLLPLDKYKPETMAIKYDFPLAVIITSRGCKYDCSFCAAKVLFPKPIYRNINNVFEEINYLTKKRNIKTLIFYDSTFTAKKHRIRKLCDLIISNKIQVFWSMETRSEDVNFDLLRLMKQAGCYYINFGVESFNEQSLKSVKRFSSIKKIEDAVKNCKRLGIMTRLEFILGLPHETRISIYKMFNKVIKINPDFVSFYPLLVLPNTPLAENNYKSELSIDELEKLAQLGYKKFYLRPAFFLSRLKHLYNPIYIKRYFDCFRGFIS